MSGRFRALPPATDVLVTATSIQAGRWHVPGSREALIMLLGMVIPGAQRRAALGAAPSSTSEELDGLVDHAPARRQGQARLTREAGWAFCP
nr:hypothetical protein [Pseudomonas luteola]